MKIKLFLILLILICIFSGSNDKKITHDQIIGYWIDEPVVASAEPNVQIFSEDGKYEFRIREGHLPNKLEEKNRKILIKRKGTWQLKENKIILYINYEEYHVGWTIENSPAFGPMLSGGKIKQQKYKKPEKEIITVSDYYHDKNFMKKHIIFDGIDHWQN